MQIKTIWKPMPEFREFDAEVNNALNNGWRLSRREVLHGEAYTPNEYGKRLLYAELVKADPVPEQPAMDPQEAIQVLARACEAAPNCEPEDCPLYDWCTNMGDDPVPKEWKLGPKKQ